MGLLFQSRPGQVVALDDPALQCDTRLLSLDPDIDFIDQRSIVTRLTVSQQVNVQFLHTLGSQIYVYVFGDRMGQVTLSGLSFTCVCDNGPLSVGDPGGESGAALMIEWYKVNRVSRRQSPIRVSIGRQVIEGFVVGFTEDVVDPSLSLVQWGVTMAALPEDD